MVVIKEMDSLFKTLVTYFVLRSTTDITVVKEAVVMFPKLLATNTPTLTGERESIRSCHIFSVGNEPEVDACITALHLDIEVSYLVEDCFTIADYDSFLWKQLQ